MCASLMFSELPGPGCELAGHTGLAWYWDSNPGWPRGTGSCCGISHLELPPKLTCVFKASSCGCVGLCDLCLHSLPRPVLSRSSLRPAGLCCAHLTCPGLALRPLAGTSQSTHARARTGRFLPCPHPQPISPGAPSAWTPRKSSSLQHVQATPWPPTSPHSLGSSCSSYGFSLLPLPTCHLRQVRCLLW